MSTGLPRLPESRCVVRRADERAGEAGGAWLSAFRRVGAVGEGQLPPHLPPGGLGAFAKIVADAGVAPRWSSRQSSSYGHDLQQGLHAVWNAVAWKMHGDEGLLAARSGTRASRTSGSTAA